MRKRFVAVIAVTGLLLAACGDDDDGSSATTDAATEDSATSDAPATTTAGAATSAAPAATSEDTDTTAAATEDTGAALPEDADPEGVAIFAYDLAAASRGGFNWDPSSVTTQTTDIGIYNWVYGALLRPNSDGELVPDLAESVEATDVNTVEIVVRDGVTTSDGTPVDGEMVKTILEGNLAKAANAAYRAGFYSAQSVEVTEPNTVIVNIPDGTAASWADTFPAGPETVIVPPGTNFDSPIGAGPFTVAAYTAGQSMTLEKNPEYWDADSINLAGIEIISIPPDNPQAAAGALSAGQVDWTRLSFAIVDAVSGDGEVVLTPDPQYLTQILICKSSAPLDDVNVRKALNLATDRDAINQALFRGAGSLAWDLWPEGHPLHNDELTDFYAHDPEAAAALLAEAGASDLTVDIIPIPGGGGPEIAQIMQQQWAEAGVTLNIVATTNFVEDLLVNNGAPLGVIPRGGNSRGKLDNFNGASTGNLCQYNDPEIADLVTELGAVSDSSDEGVELWHQIQQIFVEDAIAIPVVFQPAAFGINPDRLGNYSLLLYHGIPVPDIWELYVKS